MNIGSRTKPVLDDGKPLYLDGLELHGTWRCKPAVDTWANRTVYIALDDDDQLHLYYQIDLYNLEDGGKLTLKDGSFITANFLKAGGTGRLKIVLFDWDRDGQKDLIVGTPRHGSVPEPENGLPWNARKRYKDEGSAVLFLKNTGTDAKPVFAFPTLMKFKGNPIFLGQHECGPAVVLTDGGQKPDLIVGTETGRFMFYRNQDISID